MKIEFEEKLAFFRVGRGAFKSRKSSFRSEFWRKRRHWAYFFHGALQALGSHQPSILEEGEAFYDMRNKIVRRLPSWQRVVVVSQQRLRLRRLTLVKRISKLRFESVSFLFLACFSKLINYILLKYTYAEKKKKFQRVLVEKGHRLIRSIGRNIPQRSQLKLVRSQFQRRLIEFRHIAAKRSGRF